MGYLTGGVCYASLADATNGYFSAAHPVTTPGNPSYTSLWTFYQGAWYQYVFKTTDFTVTDISWLAAPNIYFASCDANYDYVQGGAIWAFSFSFVIAMWLVSHNIGLIMNFIRRH